MSDLHNGLSQAYKSNCHMSLRVDMSSERVSNIGLPQQQPCKYISQRILIKLSIRLMYSFPELSWDEKFISNTKGYPTNK